MRAIIDLPAKRHLNGVSLAGDDDQSLNAGLVALWFSWGIRTPGGGGVLSFFLHT